MTVQSSDVVAGLFATVIVGGLLLGLVVGLLLERSLRRKAPMPGMPDIPNAGLLLHQAPLPSSNSPPTTLKSHTSGSSRYTAQFGGDIEQGEAVQSLDRGEGSLDRPAVDEPEPEIEAIPYLTVGPSADALEQLPYLNPATGKPYHTGSLALTSGAESEGSFQSEDAVTLGVMDASLATPYLEGAPTSRAADVAEQVPYLNAATGKPHYADSLAPTTPPESEQTEDAVVLSVTDSSDAAPYLDVALTSPAVTNEAESALASPRSPRRVPVPYLP